MLDTNLFFFLNNLAGQSPALDSIVIFFASTLAYVLVALSSLLLFFWQRSSSEKIRAFIVTLSSGIAARGIVALIRFFYHRPRPFLSYHIHQLISENDWSFPSGHASFFFAISMAIHLYNKKWGIAFFIATIFMTIGRVIAGVHYPSDILGGFLVGTLCAHIIFFFVEKRSLWKHGTQV